MKKIHFRNSKHGFELEVPDELYKTMKPLMFAKIIKFRFNDETIGSDITTVVMDEATHISLDDIDIIQKDWMQEDEFIIVAPKDKE